MALLDMIKKEAKTAKWVGILLLIAGFLALIAPLAAGLSVALFVGMLFIISGVAQFFLVFRSGSFGRGLVLALLAALSFVAGVYMVMQPVAALATLTLFLAGYFIASGICEAIGAFGARPMPGWGCGRSSTTTRPIRRPTTADGAEMQSRPTGRRGLDESSPYHGMTSASTIETTMSFSANSSRPSATASPSAPATENCSKGISNC